MSIITERFGPQKPYPRNPSIDTLRDMAVRRQLATADFERAWSASRSADDPAVRAANAVLGGIVLEWERVTGTFWADRGWREIDQYRAEG